MLKMREFQETLHLISPLHVFSCSHCLIAFVNIN